MEKTFLKIQEKLNDTEWVAKQDPEIINLLKEAEDTVSKLSATVYIFVTYFEQYVDAITTMPMFVPPAPSSNDTVGPTQTSAPANRAERRARKSPLDVVNK